MSPNKTKLLQYCLKLLFKLKIRKDCIQDVMEYKLHV